MATKTDNASKQAEEAIERIRALNEQILEAGKQWGQSFLDAYEQNMRTYADFTREVTKQTTEAARRMFK